ncbi:hypothetical protein [Cellulomonas sp. FA1]|uniref:hypothetical protein n=1 Tax=Cellulomonas sp. FA1 TaxID=1346710 RepID=UPI00062584F6|nr:hypothetical protein [Cellulomonas sp. FA1]
MLVDGGLALYLERGGRTLLTFSDDRVTLGAAADALVHAVRERRAGRLTVGRIDGAEVLSADVLATPAATALTGAGFVTTPRGLRLHAS